MKKVTHYLVDLGLTEIEAEIYQGLLQTGPTTVKELAEHLHMKRITTHFNVESLIEKGLIVQTMHGARRKIMAEEPQKMKLLIEEKELEVTNLKKHFPVLIEEIGRSIDKKNENEEVEIKYYEGLRGIQMIYDDVLQADEVRSYVNLDSVSSIFPENVTLFVKEMKKNKTIKVWEIVEKSEISQKNTQIFAENERYYYKFAPISIKLPSSDVMIYDNKVAIISLTGKVNGMVLRNKNYYNISKELFDFIWKVIP